MEHGFTSTNKHRGGWDDAGCGRLDTTGMRSAAGHTAAQCPPETHSPCWVLFEDQTIGPMSLVWLTFFPVHSLILAGSVLEPVWQCQHGEKRGTLGHHVSVPSCLRRLQKKRVIVTAIGERPS